jgi:hypothetical protein
VKVVPEGSQGLAKVSARRYPFTRLGSDLILSGRMRNDHTQRAEIDRLRSQAALQVDNGVDAVVTAVRSAARPVLYVELTQCQAGGPPSEWHDPPGLARPRFNCVKHKTDYSSVPGRPAWGGPL